jgi:hypothetical protein
MYRCILRDLLWNNSTCLQWKNRMKMNLKKASIQLSQRTLTIQKTKAQQGRWSSVLSLKCTSVWTNWIRWARGTNWCRAVTSHWYASWVQRDKDNHNTMNQRRRKKTTIRESAFCNDFSFLYRVLLLLLVIF